MEKIKSREDTESEKIPSVASLTEAIHILGKKRKKMMTEADKSVVQINFWILFSFLILIQTLSPILHQTSLDKELHFHDKTTDLKMSKRETHYYCITTNSQWGTLISTLSCVDRWNELLQRMKANPCIVKEYNLAWLIYHLSIFFLPHFCCFE